MFPDSVTKIQFGGNLNFGSYQELENVFAKKELHPMDLKQSVARDVNALLEPVRNHFNTGYDGRLAGKEDQYVRQ